MDLAFRDQYPEQFSHCFGCGRNNPAGHQIESCWDGDRTIARFTPGPQYTGGVPEHAYGGLVASLMDCHGAATAFAYARRDSDAHEDIRYVTASLTVDFRRPTPIGVELEITGRLKACDGRKSWIDLALSANGTECATATMLAIRLRPRTEAPEPQPSAGGTTQLQHPRCRCSCNSHASAFASSEKR
jgi:acyl-coenzyme A thioesterase PaaI-like protein